MKIKDNELLLLAGSDIPFFAAQTSIHQPTLKEISYIGEESFFIGAELLTITKDRLSPEDKVRLQDSDNFSILMTILRDRNPAIQKSRISANLLLTLLFPDYDVKIMPEWIQLEKGKEFSKIDSNSYEQFREILIAMFCLSQSQGENYNPAGSMADKIAAKLREGRQKAAANKGEQKFAILSRYASVLATGQQQDLNELMNYTVYQLLDQYQRFELKQGHDLYLRAKLAGAKDLKEVDNWMKDIHTDDK